MITVRNGEIVIHTSDRIMFRRCRRKAYFASKLWQGLRPVRPNTTLWLGTGVHKALEDYYGYGRDLLETFNEWASEGIADIKKATKLLDGEVRVMDEMVQLGNDILDNYNIFAKKYDDFNVLILPNGKPAVEVMFKVPICNPDTGYQLYAYFTEPVKGMTQEQLDELAADGMTSVPVFYGGRFDMVVVDTLGDLWILDHKTAKTFADWTKLTTDTQVGSYIWAGEQVLPLDRPISGVIYNGLRKTVPKQPELLKKGGLSKNKSQNTTYDLYLRAIKEHGLDPAEYRDILDHLLEQDHVTATTISTKFFQRQKVKRSREEIASIAADIYCEAIDMIQAENFYPNPTRDCCWDCDFYEVCRGLYNREDVDYLLDNLYEARPDEEDEFSVYASATGEE